MGPDFTGIKHLTIVFFSVNGPKFEIDDEKPYETSDILINM